MNDSEMIPRQRADRRQLQQIIAGLTEGVILIDPDQTLFWANEAALAMHGVEDLEELGGTAAEYRQRFQLQYRNNHKLSPGDYPMDRVLAGEAFSDVIVEVASTGEPDRRCVHRIRSLVLTDTAGDPDVLLLVLHDETERFSAEERFEKTFNANPAPALICRLSDLRYVKVNLGFQEMTGYSRDEVIGRSVYEIDVLEDAERKELAVERLNEGRTIPQMEARLRLPDGGCKCVIVAGQPIEIGDEGCMLFTFMDLEPRKRAEDALRQSEERFSKSFRLMPVPTMICTMPELQILDVNDAFVAATGYAAEEVIGRTALALGLWGSKSFHQLEKALERGCGLRNADVQLKTKEGELIDCLLSAESVAIHGQRCVLLELMAEIEAVMQDTSWFSRMVIEKLASLRQPHGSNKPAAGLEDLTPREHDVLALVCQGLGDREIAEKLGLSRNTVRNQIAPIYGKTDVHHRGALVVWARERGFTGDHPPAKRQPSSRRKST